MRRLFYNIFKPFGDKAAFNTSCQNVYSGMKNYQLRYALAIVSSLKGAATQC